MVGPVVALPPELDELRRNGEQTLLETGAGIMSTKNLVVGGWMLALTALAPAQQDGPGTGGAGDPGDGWTYTWM